MKAIAIIPARYGSTRFPGKPLANKTGKYLIQHVCEQVARAKAVAEVIVATDDERIFRAVRSFGGSAVMTRGDHASGTDRVAEVAAGLDAGIVVNVQGDEPEIEPANIDKLVALLADNANIPIGTLACPFPADADPADPNAVKVVLDARGRALYFSRSLIPYPRETAGKPTDGANRRNTAAGPGTRGNARSSGPLGDPARWLLHIGIYAYRRAFLLELAKLPPTPLEQSEELEQLRVLEHGHPMAVAVVEQATVGIDTPEDYAAFVHRIGGSQ
ncbi:MAG: 3-deoxy-manno-octulosonate cytidylyltransferase [Phycisphaerae bacterium]|nr:3-deoxy-manno-octulosonate cytidylyltransferase [Phycisphaerae bacterium]